MTLTLFLLLSQTAPAEAPLRVPLPRPAAQEFRLLLQQRRDLDAARQALREYEQMLADRQDALISRACAELKFPINRCQIAMDAGIAVLLPEPPKPPDAKPQGPAKPEK